MTYIIVLTAGFLIYWFWIKSNWRKIAPTLAAVYQNYIECGMNEKKAFIKTLEFRYKPPKLEDLLDIMSEREKNNTATVSVWERAVMKKFGIGSRKKIIRYLCLLSLRRLSEVIDEYFYGNKEQNKKERRIFFHPLSAFSEVYKKMSLPHDKFIFNQDNFGITELIYCFLVIEHPKAVAYLPKENAENIINNFLQLSRNSIQATAEDPILIKDMKRVEEL